MSECLMNAGTDMRQKINLVSSCWFFLPHSCLQITGVSGFNLLKLFCGFCEGLSKDSTSDQQSMKSIGYHLVKMIIGRIIQCQCKKTLKPIVSKEEQTFLFCLVFSVG